MTGEAQSTILASPPRANRGTLLVVDDEEGARLSLRVIFKDDYEVLVAPDGVVGEVVSVEVNPSVDSLVIRCPDGKLVEQALLPAFVARIDASARRIELSSRDGLIE